MDNIIDLRNSDEGEIVIATTAGSSLSVTIQHDIFFQCSMVRSTNSQNCKTGSRKSVKEMSKRKKNKNYGWSQRGSKKQQGFRDANEIRMRMQKDRCQQRMYANAFILPTTTVVNPNPRPILQTLKELTKRIAQNPDNDDLDVSDCNCPYSTGCLGLQRYLLLQQCYQINKVLIENPHRR